MAVFPELERRLRQATVAETSNGQFKLLRNNKVTEEEIAEVVSK